MLGCGAYACAFAPARDCFAPHTKLPNTIARLGAAADVFISAGDMLAMKMDPDETFLIRARMACPVKSKWYQSACMAEVGERKRQCDLTFAEAALQQTVQTHGGRIVWDISENFPLEWRQRASGLDLLRILKSLLRLAHWMAHNKLVHPDVNVGNIVVQSSAVHHQVRLIDLDGLANAASLGDAYAQASINMRVRFMDAAHELIQGFERHGKFVKMGKWLLDAFYSWVDANIFGVEPDTTLAYAALSQGVNSLYVRKDPETEVRHFVPDRTYCTPLDTDVSNYADPRVPVLDVLKCVVYVAKMLQNTQFWNAYASRCHLQNMVYWPYKGRITLDALGAAKATKTHMVVSNLVEAFNFVAARIGVAVLDRTASLVTLESFIAAATARIEASNV